MSIGLAKKSALTFVARSVGALSQFGFNILVARMLGVEGSGLYVLSFTVVIAASIVGNFGLDLSLARLVGTNWASGKAALVRGIYFQSLLISSVASVLVSALLVLSSNYIAGVIFDAPDMAVALGIMSLSVLPYSLAWVHAGFLKCVGRPVFAGFVEVTGIPLLAIVFVLGWRYFSEPDLVSIAYCFLSASIAVIIVAVIGTLAKLRTLEEAEYVNPKTIVIATMPLLVVAALDFVVTWSPSFALGIYGNADEVGLYAAAQRTARLTTFLLVVVVSASMARFSELYQKGDFHQMDMLAKKVASILFLIGLPLVIIVVVSPSFILRIFGESFEEGGPYLQIMVIGQFVNVFTGAVAFLLILTGNGVLMRNAMVLVATTVFILNMTLVREYGPLGAAITTSVGVVLANLINVYILYKEVGIFSFPTLIIQRSRAR
ncbi:MAG: oligosaccharide flippase family protein [Porticoccaceae bacterium]